MHATLSIDPAAWIARYEQAITALTQSLAEAAAAREGIDELARALAVREAELLATVCGANEAARKAALTLAVHEDSQAAALTAQLTIARLDRDNAEAQVSVSREQCRLARAVLALAAGGAAVD